MRPTSAHQTISKLVEIDDDDDDDDDGGGCGGVYLAREMDYENFYSKRARGMEEVANISTTDKGGSDEAIAKNCAPSGKWTSAQSFSLGHRIHTRNKSVTVRQRLGSPGSGCPGRERGKRVRNWLTKFSSCSCME